MRTLETREICQSTVKSPLRISRSRISKKKFTIKLSSFDQSPSFRKRFRYRSADKTISKSFFVKNDFEIVFNKNDIEIVLQKKRFRNRFVCRTISKSFLTKTISKSFLQTGIKIAFEKNIPDQNRRKVWKWGAMNGANGINGEDSSPCPCGVRRGFHADVAVHVSTRGLMWQTRDISGWFDKFGID